MCILGPRNRRLRGVALQCKEITENTSDSQAALLLLHGHERRVMNLVIITSEGIIVKNIVANQRNVVGLGPVLWSCGKRAGAKLHFQILLSLSALLRGKKAVTLFQNRECRRSFAVFHGRVSP